MRVRGRWWVSVLLAAVLGVPLVLPAVAGAQSGGAYLDGAEPWTESDCAGDVPIVVGSDVAAQSDIYSAVTLAGVVGTDCVVLAGPRNRAMLTEQRARLDAAAAGGYVVGGTAAVPDAKLAGRDMTRLGGATRWVTAQLVGRRASGDATAGTRTAAETAEEEAEEVDLVIPPNEPYLSNYLAWNKFSRDCGFWSSDIGLGFHHCEDPEDTQYVIETSNNMLGCTFDFKAGRCQGYSELQYRLLLNTLACPENWYGANSVCYHPDHPVWWYDRFEGVSLPE